MSFTNSLYKPIQLFNKFEHCCWRYSKRWRCISKLSQNLSGS